MFKVRTYLPLFLSLVLFSCGAPLKTIYFRTNELPDSIVTSMPGPVDKEVVIQTDDILAINITSISTLSVTDPVGIFKNGGTATAASNPGYLVDKDGFIDYPALGKFKVGGLTIRQTKESLAQELKLYIKEPVVEVRIINFKITMLGAIGAQGTIIAPNHKISIIEAIAQSGGIPSTGRKENVMIIREVNGRREFAHLNLNSREVFKSAYFYLKQNDIVYVEPSKIARQESNEFLRLYLPLLTSVLSLGFTVYGITQLAK